MSCCATGDPSMKLYYHPLSGHSHRARLFLSLVGQTYEAIDVDLAKGEHKQPDYLKMNRFGQVPVLVDGETVIADSNGILVYLAKKLGRSGWLPEDPVSAAAIQRWLSVAAGQLAFGPAPEEVIGRAHALLGVMEAELTSKNWITGDQ